MQKGGWDYVLGWNLDINHCGLDLDMDGTLCRVVVVR